MRSANRPPIAPELLDPAVDLVFLRHSDAKMQATIAKRAASLPFELASVVKRRLSEALAERQKGILWKILRNDFALLDAIPYVELDEKEMKDLLEALPSAASVEAFNRDVAAKKPEKRNAAQAVRFYGKEILSPPKGILWLATRDPKGVTLLDRTVHLFTTSVDLCLERVDKDRPYLERVFLDGNRMDGLADLVFTDSDPHKGERRVLFLDLSFRAAGKSETRRVVYKPSDVEIDYRIAGKNTEELKKLFTEEHETKRFPEPHESFFELLDRLDLRSLDAKIAAAWTENEDDRARFRDLLALPTYVILPRNPGSRLGVDPDTRRLPIDSSYGYLEYLSYQPKAPELGMTASHEASTKVEAYVRSPGRWRWDPRAPRDHLDWIVDREELSRPAFRLWGRLMGIACLLLQTDLHHQNQRLRGLKPHLIDLENGLIKSCATPSETMIPEALGKMAAAGARPHETEATANQIYLRENLREGTAARLLRFDSEPSAIQINEGIDEILRVMARRREEIAAWVQAIDLANVVVRHVAELTGNLLTGVGQLTGKLLDPANRDADPEKILKELLEDRRDAAISTWKRSKSRYVREDNPKYALEIPEYNGRDFEDRSAPTYYRRAGSRDLLTWWGEVVQYKKQPGDDKTLRFDHYHKNTGIDLLKASLLEKLPEEGAKLQKVVDAFIASVFERAPFRVGGAA